jgi:pimeloyl-[acyl-carrier protein] methyl ester esterase
MNLHVEKIGSGKPLVLLHGWGMHGGMWADVAEQLANRFQVFSVDLPGYGKSGMGDGGRTKGVLDEIVDSLSAQFTTPVSVCGWSLGGQIALRWAMSEPHKIQKLILVASTPCFTQREDWQWGMPPEVLQKFAEELEQNHAATLRRFISLQLRGSENERELLALLRERLFARGEPDMNALRAGLSILRDIDLRRELAQIKMPTLIIAGERDKLTPSEASQHMAQVMPSAQFIEVKGAAHAPFLSHPEIFIQQVKRFWHE